MRKAWLALLASCIFAQSQPPIPTPTKSGQDKKQNAAGVDSNTDNRRSDASIPAVVNTPVAQNQADHEHDKTSSEHFIEILTVIIAAATVAQAAIYFCQTKLMSKTLAENRRAADAATNSQRAWVVTEPTHLAPDLVPAIPGTSGPPMHFFGYRIWNAGKSTATNVKAFAKYTILNSLDELPTVPVYGKLEDFPNRVLIPTNNADNHGFWSCKWLEPVPILFETDINEIRSRRKFLYAYGVVSYKNGMGGDGVTAFGLLYHFSIGGDWRPNGFQPAGPPEYNKAT